MQCQEVPIHQPPYSIFVAIPTWIAIVAICKTILTIYRTFGRWDDLLLAKGSDSVMFSTLDITTFSLKHGNILGSPQELWYFWPGFSPNKKVAHAVLGPGGTSSTEESAGRNVHLSSLGWSEYRLVVCRRQAGRGDKQIWPKSWIEKGQH